MVAVRILIYEDQPAVRADLRTILEQEGDFDIVGEAAKTDELLSQASRWRPDVVIMDLSVAGRDGLEAIPHLRQAVREAKVLVRTVHEDPAYFFRALEAGAAGYVLKRALANELRAALRLVAQGGMPIPRTIGQQLLADYLERVKGRAATSHAPLSPRERQVVRLIADGLTNKEIAELLSVKVRTVERHRSSIMNKLGLYSQAELVSYAVRQGLRGGGGSQSS